MGPRSNIGASLNRKRQASFLKKLFVYFIFTLFFVFFGVWGLTTDKARIKSIVVLGNITIATEDIMNSADSEINQYYLWIIPTNNILLLRSDEIESKILNDIKKINSVKVMIDGIDKIEISVTERQSRDLWCMGNPTVPKDCYFMDVDGFIFEQSPIFSEDSFPKYFGLIAENNPIGQTYFKNNFRNIAGLFNGLKNISFNPKYFNALDEHEYEIYLSGGGKILVSDSKSFESSLINLQALVSNEYIKNDAVSLKKIKYIDLRFGNKVVCNPSSICEKVE